MRSSAVMPPSAVYHTAGEPDRRCCRSCRHQFHHQLVFHDLLGQLCPVGADGGITVQNEDIVGCLLHNELKDASLPWEEVSMLASTPIFSKPISRPIMSSGRHCQHIEAAAGAHTHDGGLAGGKFGQGGDPVASKLAISSSTLSSRPNMEAMVVAFCRTLSTTPSSVSVAR